MLSSCNCLRVIRHIVASELASQRGAGHFEILACADPHESLTDGRLAVDSIEVMGLARAVSDFFELHRNDQDEWLLRRNTLSQWRDVVMESLADPALSIGFRSGGSSGEPKTIRQPRFHLEAEVKGLANIVGAVKRIVCTVPLNHIYGFLWGPLLSEGLDVPLVDGEEARKTSSRPLADDLIIGFPEWWRFLQHRNISFAEHVTGITSTAPCPPDLIHKLREQGLARMIEVYGSSETGGIGWRDQTKSPYQLMYQWRKADDRTLVSASGLKVTLADEVKWHDNYHLEPVRRADGAIQVGGTNVWPDRVRETIQSHPEVDDCAVRTFETDDGTRLKAFIVPGTGAEDLQSTLRHWLKTRLTAPERPVRLDFGHCLPRNDMGKLCDW